MSDAAANRERIQAFYDAFARQDAEGMVACYHPDVRFSDPVFPDLRGPRAGNMWRMLCDRATDLAVESSDIVADATTGIAHWEAWYTFATGRRVHNRIDARFEFEGDKIISHRDHFDFWRWTRMALGPAGLLLGWTPLVKAKVRSQAARALAEFERSQ